MLTGALLVFTVESGLLAIVTATYLAGGLLFFGCALLVVVAVRVIREVVRNKKASVS